MIPRSSASRLARRTTHHFSRFRPLSTAAQSHDKQVQRAKADLAKDIRSTVQSRAALIRRFNGPSLPPASQGAINLPRSKFRRPKSQGPSGGASASKAGPSFEGNSGRVLSGSEGTVDAEEAEQPRSKLSKLSRFNRMRPSESPDPAASVETMEASASGSSSSASSSAASASTGPGMGHEPDEPVESAEANEPTEEEEIEGAQGGLLS